VSIAPKINFTDTDWHASKEGWIDAAYEEFVEGGIESVRIVQLSLKLKQPRTAFYWFFKDREALLTALLERWRSKSTENLMRQCQLPAQTVDEAILNVCDCWLDPGLFDSKFELAVRHWAQQSPYVAAEVLRADAVRMKALQGLFVRFGFDESIANVRARAVYLTQVGYIAMESDESLATRLKRIPVYVEIFTGSAPSQGALEKFRARHREEDIMPPKRSIK
jgi:AcrR family transcriptional regulator